MCGIGRKRGLIRLTAATTLDAILARDVCIGFAAYLMPTPSVFTG